MGALEIEAYEWDNLKIYPRNLSNQLDIQP
jgi:hypothetical protein